MYVSANEFVFSVIKKNLSREILAGIILPRFYNFRDHNQSTQNFLKTMVLRNIYFNLL